MKPTRSPSSPSGPPQRSDRFEKMGAAPFGAAPQFVKKSYFFVEEEVMIKKAPSEEGAVSEADWGREDPAKNRKSKQHCGRFSPSVTAFAVPPPSSEGGGFLPLTPAFRSLFLTFLTA